MNIGRMFKWEKEIFEDYYERILFISENRSFRFYYDGKIIVSYSTIPKELALTKGWVEVV